MPINASFEYQRAELAYLSAKTTDEKINALKVMLQLCPRHKGSENLVAGLNRRLAKLKEEKIREKEIGKRKGHSVAVKKEGDAMVCIIGLTKSGKSLFLSKFTNASPQISEVPYTTLLPEIGTLDMGAKIQLVELPAIRFKDSDKEFLAIAKNADLVIIIANNFDDAEILNKKLDGEGIQKRITLINKKYFLKKQEIENINRKKWICLSLESDRLDYLKEKIFSMLDIIRVYTKEPGKEHTKDPMVIKKGSAIKGAAEKIRKDFSKRFKFARVWGKSAKFPGQRVGIGHRLEDQDILELHLD